VRHFQGNSLLTSQIWRTFEVFEKLAYFCQIYTKIKVCLMTFLEIFHIIFQLFLKFPKIFRVSPFFSIFLKFYSKFWISIKIPKIASIFPQNALCPLQPLNFLTCPPSTKKASQKNCFFFYFMTSTHCQERKKNNFRKSKKATKIITMYFFGVLWSHIFSCFGDKI